VLLNFLAPCGLYLFFLLMVFVLVLWRLVIGRTRFLILVGWSIYRQQFAQRETDYMSLVHIS